MNVPVLREGMTVLFFDENDVRETCGKLCPGMPGERCIALMLENEWQCVACYAVLRITKRPFTIKVSTRMAEQRN